MFDTLCVEMSTVVCAWLPAFALRVQAWGRTSVDQPVALASLGTGSSVVLECSQAALEEGVRPGMTVAQALGSCAHLEVVEADSERVEQAAGRFVGRMERAGCAVHPAGPGRAYFDVGPLCQMYGGLDSALVEVRSELTRGASIADGVRFGRGPNPFVASVAARLAADGQAHAIAGDARSVAAQLADLPVRILPAGAHMLELLDALGVRTLGQFAALSSDAVADRFGARGRALHQLATGDDCRVLRPRVPSEAVSSRLQFPEPIGSEIALQRAVTMLAQQAVHHPLCASYAPRIVRVVATLATGGSWQSRRALRSPSVDPMRIALTAQAKLAEIPAPVEELTLELMSFELRSGVQESLQVDPGRAEVNVGAQVATRRVQEAVGEEALLHVLELEPWSRMSERHAVLVPIDVGEAS